jgi:rubredoxin
MIKMKYCKKCGWILEYRPRSYQEHIMEILGKQKKSGYWECPKCGSIKKLRE